jgi:hypothetical protein
MAAATGITPLDRPRGQIQQYRFTLDPGSIAPGARELETIAIPGVQVGDAVIVTPDAQLGAGLIVGYARVSAVGAIEFSIENNAAGAVDQASGSWTCTIIRGTTMAFAR